MLRGYYLGAWVQCHSASASPGLAVCLRNKRGNFSQKVYTPLRWKRAPFGDPLGGENSPIHPPWLRHCIRKKCISVFSVRENGFLKFGLRENVLSVFCTLGILAFGKMGGNRLDHLAKAYILLHGINHFHRLNYDLLNFKNLFKVV